MQGCLRSIAVGGNPVTSANPARPGGWYSIWLTGLGAAPGGTVVALVRLRIENIPVYGLASTTSFDYGSPEYAGASPAFPRLYQINFKPPDDVANLSGCLPGLPCGYGWELSLDVSAAGRQANAIRIPVLPVADVGLPLAPPPAPGPPPAPQPPKK